MPWLSLVCMNPNPERRPGDYILDRYCPNLNSEDREIARGRLQSLTSLLVRIAQRQVEEERTAS